MREYRVSSFYVFMVMVVLLWGWEIESSWAQDESQREMGTTQEDALPSMEQGIVMGTSSDQNGASEEVIRHTVKKGDTLWDITQLIWRDPFLWPKVWRNNQYIINPDLIYPGNVLVFPRELPEIVEKELPPPPPAPPVVKAPLPVEPPPPPAPEPKRDLSLLASSGYILYGQKASGTVVGGRNNREMVGDNEIAYIRPHSNVTLVTGDRIALYRNIRKVYHPETKKYIGNLIRVLGMAEVIESEEETKTVQIVKAYRYITQGDSALPYEAFEFTTGLVERPVTVESQEGSSEGLEGYIVEVKDDRISQAQFDIVYIDRGSKDGVRVRDRFVVVRQGDKTSNDVRLPTRTIGHLEILIVQETTSTARVVYSTDVIHKGDQIQAAPPS